MHKVHVDHGKYTFINDLGRISIKRHGEEWVADVNGANAISSMMAELDAARVVLAAVRKTRDTSSRAWTSVPRIAEALALHGRLVGDTMNPSDWCQLASKPVGVEYAWNVRFYWEDGRGQVESGASTAFPESASALDVIIEIAKWRGVDLTKCTSIEARRGARLAAEL